MDYPAKLWKEGGMPLTYEITLTLPNGGTLTMSNKISKDEFVLTAIKKLRTTGYKGIHSVYSGHNQAFKEYFGEDADPIAHTRAMQKAKKLVIIPAKGGVMLYDAKDAPKSGTGKATLDKMGL